MFLFIITMAIGIALFLLAHIIFLAQILTSLWNGGEGSEVFGIVWCSTLIPTLTFSLVQIVCG